MQFTSLEYLPFLAVVYVVFRLAGDRARWLVLVVASLLFYAALSVPYLPLVLMSVVATTYFFGRGIDSAQSPGAKRAILSLGIAANLIVLVALKYLPVLASALRELMSLSALGISIPAAPVLVAIGVSYYVFQAISYLVDIYLETQKPERHFGYFTLYLIFFPKLLQGPIERGNDLIPQLRAKYEFDYDNLRFGLLLFAWGLFKKVVIADRLGLYVDTCYGNVHSFSGLSLVLGTYAYAFQIFMDFSGYTDMALGSARLFNIRLTENFRDPFLSTSIVEFWRRWHISFSRWILDYIFRPLQLRWRNWTNWGTAAALFVTFVVCGIWHEATPGFLLFGVLHGIYMATSVFYAPWEKKFLKRRGITKGSFIRACEIFLTFNLACFAWIFFRADTLDDAWYVVTHLVSGLDVMPVGLLLARGRLELGLIVALSIVTIIVSFSIAKYQERFLRSTAFRWTVYYALIFSVLAFGYLGNSEFLYFRF